MSERSQRSCSLKYDGYKAFIRELASRVPQHGDEQMTIAEQLEQKGREEGILIGEQRGIALGEERAIALGRQRGEQRMKLTLACNMLQLGVDDDIVMKVTGLSMEELVALNN